MCLTKAYDGPHQTTIILSTPFERKHPIACLTDVFPEVVILVNQSTKDVKVAMFPLSRFLFISYFPAKIVKNWLSEYNKIVFLLSSVKNLFKSRANYKINNHLFLFPRRILASIFFIDHGFIG
jgi:hypothetical protein